MESLAAATNKKALISLLASDPYSKTAVCEILPLAAVETVIVEHKTRYASHHIYRRKNGASMPGRVDEDSIYIHLRNKDDIAAIRALNRVNGEFPSWYHKFYGEV